VIEQHPRDDGERYEPDDVKRWLGTVARRLHAQQLQAEGSGSDLTLDQLWRAAGSRAPRYLSAVAHGLLTAVLLVTLAWRYSLSVSYPLDRTGSGKVAIGAGVAIIALVTWRASRVDVVVMRLDAFELRTVTGRRAIARGLAQLMAIGLFIGIAFVLIIGLGHWIGLSLRDWLASGLVIGLVAGSVWIMAREKRYGLRRIVFIIVTYSLAGILCGYLFWGQLDSSIEYQIAYQLVYLFSGMLLSGLFILATSLTEEPSAIDHPSDLVPQGVMYDLTFGVGLIGASGAFGGFSSWFDTGRFWNAPWIIAGLAAGVAIYGCDLCPQASAGTARTPGSFPELGLPRWIAAAIWNLDTVPPSRISELAYRQFAKKRASSLSGLR
jgi:hypothetical protein